MSAVNNPFAVRHFVFAVDKDRALATQLLHHEAVMNDFLSYVDRRPKRLERNFAAKAQAVALLRRLAFLVPKVRAGLVTYDDGAHVRTPLTADEDVLFRSFGKVNATGGGDVEEGVDKGIDLALQQKKMGWSKAAQRVLVVIGDAPPHEPDVAAALATTPATSFPARSGTASTAL